MAPRNRDVLPQPTKASHKKKPDEDWRNMGKAFVVGDSGKESDSYIYDESNDKRKKEVNVDEIKKNGLYEVPEKFDDDNDDVDDNHQPEGMQNEKNINKEELSKTAVKQHLYEIPDDEEDKGEEFEKKMKEEDGTRRDSGMTNGDLSSLADEGTQKDKETLESYEDSEVLDYAKKFRGKGRVVLDFSKGKDNAKIIVYKYGAGRGGLDSIEERTGSKLDKRDSLVEKSGRSQNWTRITTKKSVICMLSICNIICDVLECIPNLIDNVLSRCIFGSSSNLLFIPLA